jgi:hypothetical protein
MGNIQDFGAHSGQIDRTRSLAGCVMRTLVVHHQGAVDLKPAARIGVGVKRVAIAGGNANPLLAPHGLQAVTSKH